MIKLLCPACGSKNISSGAGVRTITDSFSKKDVSVVVWTCNDCKTEGDFFNQNDKNVTKAFELMGKETATRIIDDLEKGGMTLPSIERVFGLAQRTLTKWKAGDVPQSGVELLKILKTFPCMLYIADYNYNIDMAREIMKRHLGEDTSEAKRP